MSNGLRKLLRKAQKLLGRRQGIPGRTFVRNQGCYNCVHFCRPGEPLFEQHKIATGVRDVNYFVKEQGLTPDQAAARIAHRESTMAARGAGLCLGGGSQADFVSARYLCSKWVGRVAVDKTQGGVDPLPDELKDQLGDPSRANPAAAAIERVGSERRSGPSIETLKGFKKPVS